MRELVGHCDSCGKKVYSEIEMFTGVNTEGMVLCSFCEKRIEELRKDKSYFFGSTIITNKA